MHNSCCYAAMHCSTWLYSLWEPFSLLHFIARVFCFIWLRNEVFVKWSVLWSKVVMQFDMSDCGLVTVGWDCYKICLFCAVGIEGVLCDCYVWAGVMLLLWWVEMYSTCNYSGYWNWLVLCWYIYCIAEWFCCVPPAPYGYNTAAVGPLLSCGLTTGATYTGGLCVRTGFTTISVFHVQ